MRRSENKGWKENIEDRVKLLESNALNCPKITTADLRKYRS